MTSTFAGGFALGAASCLVVPAVLIAVGVGALQLLARWGIARDKRRGGQ